MFLRARKLVVLAAAVGVLRDWLELSDRQAFLLLGPQVGAQTLERPKECLQGVNCSIYITVPARLPTAVGKFVVNF